MTSETAQLHLNKRTTFILFMVAGLAMFASSYGRSSVVMSYFGDLAVFLFLWIVNIILVITGIAHLIGDIQLSRGNVALGKSIVTITLMLGIIGLTSSLLQQIFFSNLFCCVYVADSIGWLGLVLSIIGRRSIK